VSVLARDIFGVRDKASIVQIAIAAVMAALVCVTTMLIQVPIPATTGYFNIGDAMIMTAALAFGPVVGAIAGGLGSALADLLGGWYVYAIPTLIIKGFEGFIAGWIINRSDDINLKTILLAWMVGGCVMVLGYFTLQVYLYGFGGAIAELPFNVVQMTVGGLVGIPLFQALRRRLKL
jgi:uncharacterized membrane protein